MGLTYPDGWTDEMEARYQADLQKWREDPTINQGYVMALSDPEYGRALYKKFVIDGC